MRRSARLAIRRASALAKSSSVVSFTLPLSPANVATLMPGPFGQRGVVGEILAAFAGGAAMRLEQRGELERLRRLHRAQLRAVDRAGDMAAGVDALDRVGDLQRRDRGAGFAAGGDGARNQLGRAERPRRVVHQHDVGRARAQRLEAGPHRGLPRCAAEHRGKQPQALGGGLVGAAVVGMDHRLHRADLAVPGEQRQARPDHRLAGQLAVLLGQIAAGAQPASGCDNHGGDRGAHSNFRPNSTIRPSL